MKWPLTFLCVLTMSAVAEELPPGTLQLSTSMVCGEYNPNIGEPQYEEYGEMPFLQGRGQVMGPQISRAYGGTVRMFLNPENGNFTVYMDLNEQLTCLIVTGDGMLPIIDGDSL